MVVDLIIYQFIVGGVLKKKIIQSTIVIASWKKYIKIIKQYILDNKNILAKNQWENVKCLKKGLILPLIVTILKENLKHIAWQVKGILRYHINLIFKCY